jgi:hypothetical protein
LKNSVQNRLPSTKKSTPQCKPFNVYILYIHLRNSYNQFMQYFDSWTIECVKFFKLRSLAIFVHSR